MTDKRFCDEYKRYIESAELPSDYQAEILSVLKESKAVKREKPAKYLLSPGRKLALSLAAAFVLVVGLISVCFSFGNFNSQDITMSFNVMSATNLKRIQGAKIVFRTPSGQLLKDKNGETLTAFTDENGAVSVTLPSREDYTVEVTADGFIALEESAESGNYYISPVMDDDTYRAVLTWGKDCDLDAHLSVTAHENTDKINYYNSDIKDADGVVTAALDIDSETGDAPETITFNADESSLYRFSVGSYSALKGNSPLSLFEAKPKVTLYQGQKVVGTYTLDKDTTDNVWCVFEIEKGGIKLCDYTYSVNAVIGIE